jgi:hypothetical protein
MFYKSVYLAQRNPSIAPEDWPKAWRSHPREVAKLGPVGAAIGAAIDTINYCARVREPMLDGERVDLPGVSQAHDGVAVVSSRSEDLIRIGENRDGQEAVIADEIRVFGRPADEFAMAAREALSLGGPPAQAAIVRFFMRAPGVSHEAFLARWADAHGEPARRAVAEGRLARYVQNAVVRSPPGYEFDGIAEAWFASVEEAVRALLDPSLAALMQETPEFCDPNRGVTMLTEVIFRMPRQ